MEHTTSVSRPNREPAGAVVGTATADLNRWLAGDLGAAAPAVEWVYGELRRIAGAYARRERPDHTLQATALVHEAYVQLFGERSGPWQSRRHFLRAAARVMRHVLVDYSRRRQATKRGGDLCRVPLVDDLVLTDERAAEVLAVDEALSSLARLDPGEARLVELRFFAGLSLDETADCLGVSRKTVIRRWRRTRAWLHAELGFSGPSEAAGAT